MEMEDMGYVVSPARLTAFGLLAEAVRELLEINRKGLKGEEFATKRLSDTYDALMKIVAEETHGIQDPTGSASDLSPRQ